MEEVEKKEEIKKEKKVDTGFFPFPLLPYSYQIEALVNSLRSIEDTMGFIGRSLIQKLNRLNENAIYLTEILEKAYIPPEAFEFDKVLTVTSAIAAGSSLTIGSFTVPENMEGVIQKVGLSIPAPGSAGNTTMRLQINKSPVRDWTWAYNASFQDTGVARGILSEPIPTAIPVAGGDLVEFIVSAVLAEASASYGVRLKGWFKGERKS